VQSNSQLTQQPDATTRDTDDQEDHGRIGYGRYSRFTPAAIAAIILIGLLAAGFSQWRHSTGDSNPPRLVGKPAPDFALDLFNGQHMQLSDYRGSIVVLNFWASWCAPCKEEAPMLQTIDPSAVPNNAHVAVIGVDLKNDQADDARAFVSDLGITYPTGQDVGGDVHYRGPIEISFGIAANYPTTVFIRPDGVIDSVYIGQLDQDALNRSIAAAAD
jgi:cytochrome c biogenesis protein CcmG, thiol:disulfide interchange protein DsbE